MQKFFLKIQIKTFMADLFQSSFMDNKIHPLFSDIIQNKTFLVLIDPHITENNGYLRSVPLIERLSGYSLKTMITWEAGQNCKYPLNLCQDDLSYKHPLDSRCENHFLGIAVRMEQDETSNYVQRLIDCPTPRIFITNNCDYVPNGWSMSYLPITQRSHLPPISFTTELSSLLKKENLGSYVLPETKTLTFIELAYLSHKITGEKVSSLEKLFDYHSEMAAILPIWDWAIDLIELKKQNSVVDKPTFVFNAIRPWIEHNMHVGVIRDIIYELLDSVNFNREGLIKKRNSLLSANKTRILEKIRINQDPTFQRLIGRQLERIQW
jgi:hypothetical protein